MAENIFLVGFSGSGKSAIGQALARRLGRPFIDTDRELIARFGMAIGEVFTRLGEPAFRDAESEAVAAAGRCDRAVVSLGGGAIVRPENLAAARGSGVLVRLVASPETIYRRLTDATDGEERPMLRGDDPRRRIEALLREREPIYAQADIQIATDQRSIDEVVGAIVDALARARSERLAGRPIDAGSQTR